MLPLITLFTGKKANGLPTGLPERGANLARAKLKGLNLEGESLPQADLAYADLRGTNLSNANLDQAYFADADLSGARLTGANLRRANFRGANLTGADLKDADLRHASFDVDTRLPFSRDEAESRGMRFNNERTALP